LTHTAVTTARTGFGKKWGSHSDRMTVHNMKQRSVCTTRACFARRPVNYHGISPVVLVRERASLLMHTATTETFHRVHRREAHCVSQTRIGAYRRWPPSLKWTNLHRKRSSTIS